MDGIETDSNDSTALFEVLIDSFLVLFFSFPLLHFSLIRQCSLERFSF